MRESSSPITSEEARPRAHRVSAEVSEGATIIVVDDDDNGRELLDAWLRPFYRVLVAGDAREGLELVRRERPDLVILDVMMPQMSGFDACRIIKTEQSESYLPVMLVTALDGQDDRNRGLSAGADEFLSKPVDRAELLLRSRSLIQLRRQEALIRAQLEDLRRLGTLKDDLVSLLVHDLRNPLQTLLFNLELVRRYCLARNATGVERVLGDARVAAGRLGELMDDVLQVRLLEEGKLPLRALDVGVRGLLTAAAATVDGVARQVGVGIEIDCPGELRIEVDAALARRAVENVLANAITHSDENSAVLLRARPEGNGVLVEIADRGPGVPDELKASIFEKFGTVRARQAKARRSHGLGLFFVKLVVTAHGGSASVHDRDGGGSLFQLFFPASPTP